MLMFINQNVYFYSNYANLQRKWTSFLPSFFFEFFIVRDNFGLPHIGYSWCHILSLTKSFVCVQCALHIVFCLLYKNESVKSMNQTIRTVCIIWIKISEIAKLITWKCNYTHYMLISLYNNLIDWKYSLCKFFSTKQMVFN